MSDYEKHCSKQHPSKKVFICKYCRRGYTTQCALDEHVKLEEERRGGMVLVGDNSVGKKKPAGRARLTEDEYAEVSFMQIFNSMI